MTCPRITVVGSSNFDLFSRPPRFPRPGETLIGGEFRTDFGGKGANQAVTAARLGGQVTLVTRIGKDVFGQGMLQNFEAQGIETRYVFVDETRASGVADIWVDDQGQNVIIISPGANGALTPEDARRAADAIQSAAVVVCQLEVPTETVVEAFRIARAAGARTILNTAPAAAIPDELIALSDIVSPNETEIELLTGLPATTLDGAAAAAQQLLARGARTVVVTLGKRGALLAQQDSLRHVSATPVQAIDTTGAGDCFIGALAVFLGEGQSLDQAIEWANIVAGVSVTRRGTQASFPRREEIAAQLA
ncbi:MAG: ribokinase [Anaerolineae bacterium]